MCIYIHILYLYYIYIYYIYIYLCVLYTIAIVSWYRFFLNPTCPVPKEHPSVLPVIHLPSFQAIRHGQDSRLPHPSGWAFDQESSAGRWCSDPCPVKSLDMTWDDQVDKWAQQKEPSALSDTMPTLWQGVVVPEKLEYFRTWIQHQPATVFAQGELVLQITKDAETLCSYHALQIVPLIGGIRRDKDGNCERVEQWYSDTDRQEISRKKPYLMRKKQLFPADFSSNRTNCTLQHHPDNNPLLGDYVIPSRHRPRRKTTNLW